MNIVFQIPKNKNRREVVKQRKDKARKVISFYGTLYCLKYRTTCSQKLTSGAEFENQQNPILASSLSTDDVKLQNRFLGVNGLHFTS